MSTSEPPITPIKTRRNNPYCAPETLEVNSAFLECHKNYGTKLSGVQSELWHLNEETTHVI